MYWYVGTLPENKIEEKELIHAAKYSIYLNQISNVI